MKSVGRAQKWDPRRSPVGWYLATYIERFEFAGEDTRNLRRRCRAWENTILVKAETPAQAYQRAIRHAKQGRDTPWKDSRGQPGKLVFEGLVQLLPIYDELEDGAEISWTDHQNVSVQKVQRRVRRKTELAAFKK